MKLDKETIQIIILIASAIFGALGIKIGGDEYSKHRHKHDRPQIERQHTHERGQR
jgi:hypothetical protein